MMQTLRKPGRKQKTHFVLGISSLRPLSRITRTAWTAENPCPRQGKPTGFQPALIVPSLPNATLSGVGANHAQAQKTH
jgi:hypothetical protein